MEFISQLLVCGSDLYHSKILFHFKVEGKSPISKVTQIKGAPFPLIWLLNEDEYTILKSKYNAFIISEFDYSVELKWQLNTKYLKKTVAIYTAKNFKFKWLKKWRNFNINKIWNLYEIHRKCNKIDLSKLYEIISFWAIFHQTALKLLSGYNLFISLLV